LLRNLLLQPANELLPCHWQAMRFHLDA
jgi:hypothetical protein